MADRRSNSSGSAEPDDKSAQKYTGVRKRKWGKWVSEIRLPNSRDRIWLGSYDKPEQAARAFDAAQFCLRGPHARFNFPDTPPAIDGGGRLSAQEIQAAAAKFAAEGDDEPAADVEAAGVEVCSGAAADGDDWPVWDLLDGGSDFGFGDIMARNEMMTYDEDFNLGVQNNMEEDEFVYGGGEYFCHGANFLWNFDNY